MSYFYLVPRYTCGSPGAVDDERLAKRVAQEEKRAYEHALEGVYGPAAKVEAETLGLEGIVQEKWDTGHGKKVHDLITDRRFRLANKTASKLKVGDLVVRYDDRQKGNFQCVRFRVAQVLKSDRYVGLRQENGDIVFAYPSSPATIELPWNAENP